MLEHNNLWITLSHNIMQRYIALCCTVFLFFSINHSMLHSSQTSPLPNQRCIPSSQNNHPNIYKSLPTTLLLLTCPQPVSLTLCNFKNYTDGPHHESNPLILSTNPSSPLNRVHQKFDKELPVKGIPSYLAKKIALPILSWKYPVYNSSIA